MIPATWPFALLALAAFRCWWLLANDAILNPLRRRVLKRWPSEALTTFMDCPWCSGCWLAVGWWVAWLCSQKWTVWVAVPFALSAVVGILGMALNHLADD